MFRKITLLALVLALGCWGTAQGQDQPAKKYTFKTVIQELLGHLDDFSKDLEGIKSNDDAKDLQKQMDDRIKKVEKLVTEAKKLGKPTKAQEEELKKEFEGKLQKTMTRFSKAAANAFKYPVAKEMIEKFGKTMGKFDDRK